VGVGQWGPLGGLDGSTNCVLRGAGARPHDAYPTSISPSRRHVIRSKHSVWLQLALAAGLLASIVGATKLASPLYATRPPLATQLIEHRYLDSSAGTLASAGQSTDSSVSAVWASPAFFHDRDLFAMDLVRTGKVEPDRARSLADIAVREAYTRKIPPALVLGVMLTENDEFKSTAKSNVGAVGLMQIEPKSWVGTLGRKFGTNLKTDSTNLKYGIYILGWVTQKASKLFEDADDAWRHALLNYNGCVSGKNTPDCHAYPDVVKRNVVQAARSTCQGASFDKCVVQPMWASRLDATTEETVASTK
jgi:transglycosylase-like protein with SLT domain